MKPNSLLIFGLAVIFVGSVLVIGGSVYVLGQITTQAEIIETDQNQGVSEFRSDGVEIVHYQDGSKLYRVGIEDGVGSKSGISEAIKIGIKDGIIGTNHPCNLDETVYMTNVSEPNVNYTLPNCIE